MDHNQQGSYTRKARFLHNPIVMAFGVTSNGSKNVLMIKDQFKIGKKASGNQCQTQKSSTENDRPRPTGRPDTECDDKASNGRMQNAFGQMRPEWTDTILGL